MRLLDAVRARVRLLSGRGRWEARLEEEFRLHVELETEKNVRLGLSPVEARRQALLAFGAAESYREELRAGRGLEWLAGLWRDARHALRSLRRTPGFTMAAVLTLALGVGASSAMFSLLSALLFRPLPFADPDRLVVLYQSYEVAGAVEARVRWSYPEYEVLRGTADVFAGVAAYNVADANVTGAGDALLTSMELVAADYFGVLGLAAAAGRFFTAQEDLPGTAPVVVLSHASSQQWFGGAREALGRTIRVNDVPLTIIGVAPRGFRGLSGSAELWVSQAVAPQASFPGQHTTPQHFLSVVARLGDGVTPAAAAARLGSLRALDGSAARVQRAGPDALWSIGVASLDEARRGPGGVGARLALIGAVAFLLLIAIMNLSGLLLARALARQRDVSVRAALGAGTGRLLQQAFTESAVIGLSGGVAGAVIAFWCLRLLPAFVPERLGTAGHGFVQLDSFADPGIDWRVQLFAFAVALLAALLAGAAPALRTTRAARRDMAGALKAARSAPAAGSLRRPTLLSGVIVVQVASAVVLLVAAGALLHAFRQLNTLDTGVREDGVVTFRITPPAVRYGGEAAAPLLARVLERVTALPGVASATVDRCTPFMRCSSAYLYEAGQPQSRAPLVGRHYVGPDHFRTLGIPVVRGRALSASDNAGAARVAVVSETAARQLWPGDDPIGRRVWFSSGRGFDAPEHAAEIVGIVGDVLYDGRAPGPEVYTSYLQFTWPATMVMVRAEHDPVLLVPSLRTAVADIDPAIPIHDVATIAQRRSADLAEERFAAMAVAAFAGLGIVLVAIGIYGVTAYSVTRRRREIGIRIALGAGEASVLRLVVGNGVALIVAGMLGGSAVALLSARVLAVLVPDDLLAVPLMLLFALPALLAVAFAASWLPARRAARLDPRLVLVDDG